MIIYIYTINFYFQETYTHVFNNPTPQIFPSLLAFLSVWIENICCAAFGRTLLQFLFIDVT